MSSRSIHTLPLITDPLPANRLLTMPMSGPLVDTFGRVHDHIRISVTDRCNLRCTYCMPEDVTFQPTETLLRFDEIERMVRIGIDLGITQVRLTGGEPLLRKNLPELVARLMRIPGLADLALTTNGMLLPELARPLADAGLPRLNVSLDTLDPVRFRKLARRDGLERVLEGLTIAQSCGFRSIKLNAVAIRNFSEPDLPALATYARKQGFELRFIEYMPIGAEPWDRAQMLSAQAIQSILESEFGRLTPIPDADPHAPAQEFAYADGQGRVGFIASVTQPFCRRCDRIRLTADGKLRNCLFALEETDIRPWLQPDSDPAQLQLLIRQSVWAKWEGHEINSARFVRPDRTMHAIGG
ncbi:GTP 3',8-cyclase MoaA [Tuwongella immobilis]|uniref:GTP 3',8-cyclase n=1 Tax=Tuwongella immobilis TaxID=692036 RepID=A0A6C2YPC6_9BACT|nr:GTP 3',8-cyclase MoaA [Tuwongella immobilis]VIP03151.1 molybdenum cofactor biosynthesis protein : Cyclic pyranopterin monophosphate synthase OS=Isosphaera pallida (strain ATCC 43644 / DSM 9630 / IS1B) GN=moaA PE=3 SV=1: Radical_SAM: Fer4_12: Mob_synth_C [Tuwongella immobilis]VTS03540.1 molybdenum cofactor biosynthesis protein : Cyclic pyranopterin monophosphate synthase OS=Isosphaera pallida (strain ATCC 43644 / DSM 9630 / IS1B) GN=moaA PE=3 SV=1: Radical_SAM: Fer4_12: Mob_synth_C [Tuwongella 